MEHNTKDHARAVAARFMRMKWRRPLRAAGGTMAVAVGALVLMGFRPFAVKRDSPAPEPPEVLIGGAVESLKTSGVGSPYSGIVSQILVKKGERVRKGQLLFRMDTEPFRNQLAAAKANKTAAWREYRDARRSRELELSETRSRIAGLQSELRQERSRGQAASQPAPAEGEEAAVDLQAVAVAQEQPDPARIATLEEQIGEARQQLRQLTEEWNGSLWPLWQAYEAASRDVVRVENLIASADRKSPIAGLVTELNAPRGRWVEQKEPVVRVDDPDGYRVVAMVDRKHREGLEPGVQLPVHLGVHRIGGKLEKIVDGWDERVFESYLYLKPSRPLALRPGQKVEVVFPTQATLVASR